MNKRVPNIRLSCIIPAINEEAEIASTVERYIEAISLCSHIAAYELLLVDDGSKDQTKLRMDDASKRFPHIRVFSNVQNLGLGASYRKHLSECQYEYVLFGFGFMPIPVDQLVKMLMAVGSANIVLTWCPALPYADRGLRTIISTWFTIALNKIFGLDIAYYNGQAIYRKSDLLSMQLKCERSGAQAEATVRLIKMGRSFIEIPLTFQTLRPKAKHSNRISNYISVFKFLIRLYFDVKREQLTKALKNAKIALIR